MNCSLSSKTFTFTIKKKTQFKCINYFEMRKGEGEVQGSKTPVILVLFLIAVTKEPQRGLQSREEKRTATDR